VRRAGLAMGLNVRKFPFLELSPYRLINIKLLSRAEGMWERPAVRRLPRSGPKGGTDSPLHALHGHAISSACLLPLARPIRLIA
jgi:hypothetical protein